MSNEATAPKGSKKVSLRDIWAYATGEGANSIAMNGISNFAMLYFTKVLGMGAEMAGLAIALTTFWDAVFDPIMGTISDQTRSRWGRRHPYILGGGLVLALSFLFLWFIPTAFTEGTALFIYIIAINLVLRTAVAVFSVPYTALGFEICEDYDDRAKLQGIRYFFNMTINFVFGACAWVLFFKDGVAADGSRLDGTFIKENYLTMGVVLTITMAVLIVLCTFGTKKYAKDTSHLEKKESHVKTFIADMKAIFSDKLAWNVFIFFGFAQFAMLLVSQVQMFTYVDYMQFLPEQKTIVHGGGMIGFALGSLALGKVVRRLDKKATGYLAMVVSSIGGLGLWVVFSGGLLPATPEGTALSEPVAIVETVDSDATAVVTVEEAPEKSFGEKFSGFANALTLQVGVFGGLQMLWWLGCGMLVPLATSMIADIAEMRKLETGEVKDGSYSAIFCFFMKASVSVGLFLTGFLLKWVGYDSELQTQATGTVNNLALMTFLSGPFLMLCSFVVLKIYPVTKTYLEDFRAKYADS